MTLVTFGVGGLQLSHGGFDVLGYAPERVDRPFDVLDDFIAANPALWWAAGAVMVTALLRGLCSFGQRAQLSRGSEAYVKGLRDDLYRRIQYLPFAWHKQHPTGDIIQRCTSDVDVIRTFVCNQLVEVVRTVFLIILYLWIMFRMNVKLSLIALAFIPIVGLSSGVFYRKISSRFKTADEAEGVTASFAKELIRRAVLRATLAGREVTDDDLATAQAVIVQSNNAMYQGTAQIEQQFAITRARAAELRRDTLVVTTSGITGLIDPTGRVTMKVTEPGPAVGVVQLGLRTGTTTASWLATPLEVTATVAAALWITALTLTPSPRRR